MHEGSHLFPVVLAGPSGGGKTTVRKALLGRRSDLRFSVSATTRRPRPGEEDGLDYRFMERAAFLGLAERKDLLEWAEVHGELYGTPRENVTRARAEGCHLLLDIDVQGAGQLRVIQPDAVTVFLLPPDYGRLEQRLRGRGSEDETTLRRRMRTTLAELAEVEQFDYAVVNDTVPAAVDQIDAIISAEQHRVNRLGPDTRRRIRELSESLIEMLDTTPGEEAKQG
jgi:guanylate kinase